MTTALTATVAREMIALIRIELDGVYAGFHRGEIDQDELVRIQDELHAQIAAIRARIA